MDDTSLDRFRCLDPQCGRAFALVYRRCATDAPVWLTLACPHCGTPHLLMVQTSALHRAEGAYVLPLGAHDTLALSA